MSEATIPDSIPLQKLWHNLKLLIPALILFAILTGIHIWRLYGESLPWLQPETMPISTEIEERFGVRLLGVHLVGRDGLVDLRYRVVDAGKAKNFGHYTETSPLIIAEDSGKLVEVTIMGLHNHRVEAGRTYYILYRNTANALRSGSKVTIQLDDLSLQHVPVQ